MTEKVKYSNLTKIVLVLVIIAAIASMWVIKNNSKKALIESDQLKADFSLHTTSIDLEKT